MGIVSRADDSYTSRVAHRRIGLGRMVAQPILKRCKKAADSRCIGKYSAANPGSLRAEQAFYNLDCTNAGLCSAYFQECCFWVCHVGCLRLRTHHPVLPLTPMACEIPRSAFQP